MAGPVFFAFIAGTAPQTRDRIVESLLLEFMETKAGRPVLVNLDPSSNLRLKTGRPSKDEPVGRYGNTLASSGVPILKPSEAADFFEDAVKTSNAAMSDGRVFIALMNEVPKPEMIALFDAICFAVTMSPASTAFIYGAVKAMEAAGKNIPVRVMIVGEQNIEKTAEFYVSLAREFKMIGTSFSELSYAGFMAFDPEETSLAAQYGVSTIEAFPQGSTKGQARQTARKIFAVDISETDCDWLERERTFLKYLRSGKY
jgi:hypothetical protein